MKNVFIFIFLFIYTCFSGNFNQGLILEYLHTSTNDDLAENSYPNIGFGYKVNLYNRISIRNYLEFGNKAYSESSSDFLQYRVKSEWNLRKICNSSYFGAVFGNKKGSWELFVGPGLAFSNISRGISLAFHDTVGGDLIKQKIILWAYRPSMMFSADFVAYFSKVHFGSEYSKIGILLGFEYKESKLDLLKNITHLNYNDPRIPNSFYVSPQYYKENCVSFRFGIVYKL